MAQEFFTRESWFEELDQKGEDVVRTDIALNRYNVQKTALAHVWLEQQIQDRRDAVEAEQTEIARAAKDAALDAAKAASVAAEEARVQSVLAREANDIARKANTRATVAMVIAVAAVIVSAVISLVARV